MHELTATSVIAGSRWVLCKRGQFQRATHKIVSNYANRRKRPRMKADAQQQRPNHQRLLKRTNNRNTGISPRSKCTKMAPNSQLRSRLGKSVPGNVRNEPMGICSWKTGENRKVMSKRMPMSLSEGSAAGQTLVGQPKGSSEVESDEDVDVDLDLDLDLDVDLDDEDVVQSNGDVVLLRKERVYWNWKRRKKLKRGGCGEAVFGDGGDGRGEGVDQRSS
ncbi:MAG: hypothetical protein GY820_03515 [Gammaproteobacteria bacterium]|nr:hypothetical protein [Gammaproteobacteria bacterium]